MQNKQVIISIGREFGSGGHLVAEKLSERLGLQLYDKNLLYEIAEFKDIDAKVLEKYDEAPKNRLFSRSVNGYSNSPQENIANIQFDYIRKLAEEGKSFIIVGRCAEEVLSDYKFMISVFVLGDMNAKIKRITEKYNITEDEAVKMISSKDKKRKSYHNYFCQGKWGDSRNYEISVNSSKIGIDRTADIIEAYIRERIK